MALGAKCKGGASSRADGTPSRAVTEETSQALMSELNCCISSRHPCMAAQLSTLPQKRKLKSVISETSQLLISP